MTEYKNDLGSQTQEPLVLRDDWVYEHVHPLEESFLSQGRLRRHPNSLGET